MTLPNQTSAETGLDNIQGFDFTPKNLPETGGNLSVQDVSAANAEFLHQDKAKTLIWFIGAGLAALLLLRVIKKLL